MAWFGSHPCGQTLLPKRCLFWLTDRVCELSYPPNHSWEAFLAGWTYARDSTFSMDVPVFGSWVVSNISGTCLKACVFLNSIAPSTGSLFVSLKIHLEYSQLLHAHSLRAREREVLVVTLESGWEGTAAPCFNLWEPGQGGMETGNLVGGLCLWSRNLFRTDCNSHGCSC